MQMQMHEYEVTSLALYYECSTSHNFIVFALYRTYSLISLHTGHIATLAYTKMFLNALSGGKYKKFTPLRQYDITGFIYAKTFPTIVINAPKNPGLPVDFSSISYILRISYQTVLAKSPWDTFNKL